jgi:hypothetical protein
VLAEARLGAIALRERRGRRAAPPTTEGLFMRHLRIALYDMTSGTAEEAIEIARAGILPIFEEQPGFVRYEVGSLDNGGVVSFSVWETADEAQHAVDLAASWVKDNLADRIKLREEHTGDLSWDEAS